MDALTLSRIQFAVAAYFHFMFVPLTLGLSLLVAIMETLYVRTADMDYLRLTKFWGRLFLINFAVGVVSGITLEFQFGTNWANYSEYVGDIFGSLLAIEATVAFFLESTFIAVWHFGWKRLSPKVHLLSIWLVAIATNISAFWILTANAWMQHPVGYVVRNGRAELADFMAIATQPFALLEFAHTLGGAYVLAGFFVLGISAWHLRRGREVNLFKKSFRIAAIFALCAILFEMVQGHSSAAILHATQPTKLAAIESHWETKSNAPLYLVAWPDEARERNVAEAVPVPGLLSFLGTGSTTAQVRGLREFPRTERPPVLPVFLSFRAMVGLGVLLLVGAVAAFVARNQTERYPWLLRLLPWFIALPYVANQLGWTVAELGRQPWIVYGLMRTTDAGSPVSVAQVATSLVAFTVLYGLLGFVDFYLLFKYARQGVHQDPDPDAGVGSAVPAS